MEIQGRILVAATADVVEVGLAFKVWLKKNYPPELGAVVSSIDWEFGLGTRRGFIVAVSTKKHVLIGRYLVRPYNGSIVRLGV